MEKSGGRRDMKEERFGREVRRDFGILRKHCVERFMNVF
jgi:hypothetical protein